jgi:hypothetical protein
VIQVRDGTEQRIATREYPRHAMSFTALLDTEAKTRALRWQLQQGIDETWRVPLWLDPARVTASAASGQADISADFTTSDVAVDDVVYVHHRNGASGEFGAVSSISSSSVTLTTNLGATYPVGSHVYPVLSGLLTEGQGIARYNVNACTIELELHASATRAPGGTGGTALTTYGAGALPVLDRYPVGTSFDESVMSGMERIDFGGAFQHANQWDVFRDVYQRRIRLASRAELQWFRLFLAAVNGQRDQFWCPTWRQDFDVISATAGASSITVDDTDGLVIAWFTSQPEPHLQIEANDGTVTRRAVSTAVPSGTTAILGLDGTNPTAAAGMKALSLLQLCRLGSDTVRIEQVQGRAYADVVIRTLDEDADV